MKKPETFQELILRLQSFWIKQGCLVTHQAGMEVGAGTLNKNTFLHVLGSKPWSVAYLEGVSRPSDGRYGDSINRLQHFYQFQVLLKPSPDDIQNKYLESLYYLGLDPAKFDIDFIEDDWEHPGLGAWGLGWEVRIFGMEITQYTYFQQCGGIDLEMMSCELAYGVERLAMCLQNVDDVYKLVWGLSPSGKKTFYGDLYKRNEIEWSYHNFSKVNIDMLFRNFNEHELQAIKLIDSNLILPAYHYVLKCNHEFNLLYSRKAVSLDNRISYINRIRKLAHLCAVKYLSIK